MRGIHTMLDKDVYCADILVQVAAVNAALNGFSKELLSQHVRTCVADDLRQVVNRLFEEYEKEHKKEITDETILERISEANSQKVHIAKSKSGIVVKGINDMAVRFSKCCNPVPGDEIVGFVTRGRGMSIHRTDCINMLHLSDVERARLIDAEWEDTSETEGGGKYLAELKMYANDRQGFLMDISKVFTEAKIDVKSMNVRTSKKGTATIDMGFIVNGREELHAIIEKLRQLQGVLDIERTTG